MSNGFLIPEIIDPQDTVCVVFKIPNDPLYRQAVRGHIWQLARWFEWEQTGAGDTRASQVATLFRTHLLDTLQIQEDCNEAIESILPEGTIVATIEEICEGVFCGNMKSIEEVAQRVLLAIESSNIRYPIEVGTDGETTVKQSTGSSSETIEAPAQEIHYGGVYNQAVQFKKLFDDMNSNIALSPITLFNLSRIAVNPLDLIGWQDLITGYQSDNPQVSISVNTLALQLFCSGEAAGTLDYAVANHNSVEAELNAVVNFAASIPGGTWRKWYDEGQTTPKTGYTAAPCYRQPSITATIDYTEYTASSNGIVIFPQNTLGDRIWRVVSSGKFVDATGREFDGVFLKDGTTFTRNQMNLGRAGVASLEPTNQPLYSADSKYGLEYNPAQIVNMISFQQAFTPVSGSMTLKLFDLGAR